MNKYFRVFFDADGQGAGVSAPVTPVVPAATSATEPQAQGVISHEDALFNSKLLKETAKEVKKYFQEAGLDPSGDLKTDLSKFKEWKQSQMSETDRVRAELEAEKKKTQDVEARASAAELKAEIIGKGVPADKADRVAKLAAGYEGATVAEKVEAVLKEFPEFVKQTTASVGVETGHKSLNEEEALLKQLSEIAGLKMKA